MTASDTSKGENRKAESRIVELLRSHGWQPLSSASALAHRQGNTREVLLRSVLEERLSAINIFEYQGQPRPFSATAIEAACSRLQQSVGGEVRYSNEQIWTLLCFGTPVLETINGDSKSFTIRYIDWDHPENNTYHVVSEFPVNSGSKTFTPDLVLFVNGIPFVVIECKRAHSAVGKSRLLDSAIAQLLTYQHERNIPRLFHFAQLLLALTEEDAVYGAVGAPPSSWTRWHEREGAPVTAKEAIAQADKGNVARHLALDDFNPFADRQDLLLKAICRPARLLELTRWFTFFTPDGRRIVRYYQYFAIEDVLRRIRKLGPGGRRRGGVISMAQGTGKTMTMIMLGRVLLDVFKECRPRVVLVTDRVEIGHQIYKSLTASGVECRQANTGTELLSLLRDTQTRVITSLVHKFDAALRARPIELDNPDIFVLVDEANRSQSGQLHHAMRRTLPRACFLGFVGVPDLRHDAGIAETFGDVISSYSIEEAIADDVTLPIQWEVRKLGHSSLIRESDTWINEYVAKDVSAGFEQDYSKLLVVLEASGRIRAIAADIAQHFKQRFSGTRLKGQVVATSRRAALEIKSVLAELGITSEALVSLQETASDKSDDLFQRFKRHVLSQFGSEFRYENDAIVRFLNADDPQIIIVVSKSLSGFDFPRSSVLYLTRPLSGPAFLQSIARINRPYEGKKAALVVDYVGMAPYLSKLLHQGGDVAHTVDTPIFESESRAAGSHVDEKSKLAEVERCCGEIVSNCLAKDGLTVTSIDIEQLAWRMTREIATRRKVEWTNDPDTQNRMKTAMEDALFEFQAERNIEIRLRTIDAMLDRCVEAAIALLPESE
jgi:type I restriction enzyme, R subunit